MEPPRERSSDATASPAASPNASTEDDARTARRRERMERMAFLLDDAIRIPGTQRRVGFDALLGLVPGIGDAAGALLSGYVLYEGARLGVSLATLLRMAANVAIEAIVGLVPGLGDLFDFAFKANNRNKRLIERHLDAPEDTRRSSRRVLAGFAIALAVLIAALAGGAVWLIAELIGALGGAA